MWIPTPLYERIPQFMLLAGVIFISSALYLGFAYHMSYFYVGVGVACLFWSVIVFAMRQHFRSQKHKDEHEDINQA